MKNIKILLILSFLVAASCKSEEKPISLADDKIHKAYQKEIAAFEADKESLVSRNSNLEKKINDNNTNSKFIDLLRKQRFANIRYLDLVEQNANLIKIKLHEREKYLADNQSKLKLEDLEKQYSDYLINKSVNPEAYPWRRLSAIEKEKKKPEAAPAADGHGAPTAEHGKAEEKKEEAPAHGSEASSSHGSSEKTPPAGH